MKTSEEVLRPMRGALVAVLVASLTLWVFTATTHIAVAGESGETAKKDAKKSDKKEKEPTHEERFETLETKFKEAKRDKNIQAMCELIDSAGDLFEDCCDDEDLQEDILKWTGKAARGVRGAAVEVAVLEELGEIGDARGAKYIKRYLRQRNPEEVTDTLKAAVDAAALVPDGSLVAPLLKIVEKSETTGIVKEAVLALGKYRACTRHRARIVETFVEEARKVKPGGRPRMRGGQEKLDGGYGPVGRESGPGARWAALSETVPTALRELTGQDIRGIGEWIRVVKAHKGKLGDLFQDDA